MRGLQAGFAQRVGETLEGIVWGTEFALGNLPSSQVGELKGKRHFVDDVANSTAKGHRKESVGLAAAVADQSLAVADLAVAWAS